MNIDNFKAESSREANERNMDKSYNLKQKQIMDEANLKMASKTYPVRTVTISERSIVSLLDEFITSEMAVLQGGKRGNKHSHLGIDQLFERDKQIVRNNIIHGNALHCKCEEDDVTIFGKEILPLVKVGEWERVNIVNCKEKGIGKCKWWEKKDKMFLNRIKELELIIGDLRDSVGGGKISNKNGRKDFHEKKDGLMVSNFEFNFDREYGSDRHSSMRSEKGSDEEEREKGKGNMDENAYMNDKELLIRARRGKYKNINTPQTEQNEINIDKENNTENSNELISVKENHQVYNQVNIRVRKEIKRILPDSGAVNEINKNNKIKNNKNNNNNDDDNDNDNDNIAMHERIIRNKSTNDITEENESSNDKKENIGSDPGLYDSGIPTEKARSEKIEVKPKRRMKRNSEHYDDEYHLDGTTREEHEKCHIHHFNDKKDNNDDDSSHDNNIDNDQYDSYYEDEIDRKKIKSNNNNNHDNILWYTVGIRTVPALLHIVSGGLGYHPIYQAQFPVRKDILVAVKLFSGPVCSSR